MLKSLFGNKKKKVVSIKNIKEEVSEIQEKKDHKMSELEAEEIAKAIRTALSK